METQAIIDIGDQKTGSKSRQAFMRNNENGLEKHGCYCLEATRVRNYDMGLAAYAGNKNQIEKFRYDRSLGSEVDLDSYIEKSIKQELAEKKAKKVIFSFEGLISLREDQVKKLTSMLYRYFSEIRVIGFLRRQDRKAVSGYSTRLKIHGATGLDILYNSNGRPRGNSYKENYATWNRFVPSQNIFFVNYDECSDVSRSFVKIAQIPEEGLIFDETRKNTSLSRLGAEVLRRFNKDLSSREEFQRRVARVRGAIKDYYSGEPLRPSKREAKAHFEYFSESNKQLAQLIGSERRCFFDEDFSEYPDEFSPIELSLSEVEEYVKKALKTS